ncbi:PD-(D/E)XK nuclease family protein [Ruminococcaceae bacterium OttesenSCG-928-L11]|nr:PD-(D/E)XK nuclease family protein [Ruminococcaceae bacterium OttesenSCG-928-L11]
MLHFVIGVAGTGKTTCLMEEVLRTVQSGRKAVVLVPEQFSFEAEKLVYATLGPRLSLEAEVLSFTRLCNSVFRRFGGLSGIEVTSASRYLLMSMALDELRDTLTVYRKSALNPTFLDTLIGACAEFKAAGVTPDKLEDFAAGCEQESLKSKTEELARIYGAYQSILETGYTDPEDSLIRACRVLESQNYFAGYDVYVDGFTAFMAGEYELLRHCMEQAEHVWVALTTDSLFDERGGTGLFSAVQASARRLRELAGRAGIPVASPVMLAEPVRYGGEALKRLARSYGDMQVFDGNTGDGSVVVSPAATIYEEALQAAARIAGLVREGYRYNEIAVVARETDAYLRPLELAFSRYDIPYFIDDGEDIENKALTGAVLSALDAVKSGFDTLSILLLAKSPVMGLDGVAVAELENYCYTWNVRGAVWQEDFAGNPRGMAGPMDEGDEARLAAVNTTRRALMEPLTQLREQVRSGNSRRFAEGIYQFLEQVQAGDKLTQYAQRLPQGEREAFLDDCAMLWDQLMGVLDIFGGALGDRKVKPARLCELFRLAVSAAATDSPPRTLDQVLVGRADRIRPGPMRAVLVLGANEGIFPPAVSTAGVFSDSERKLLAEGGISISQPSLQQVMLERYFAYYAVTLPSDKLVVTWRKSDLTGRELAPSGIVIRLRELFGDGVEQPWEPGLPEIATEKAAWAVCAEQYDRDTPLAATLRAYFQRSDYRTAGEKLTLAAEKWEHSLRDRRLAKGLFGDRLRLSPSRVERFYRCPFSFFAQDGLGLRRRQRVEYSPLESGSVIHHVLHVMVQRHGGKGLAELSRQELEQEISAIIGGYMEERVETVSLLPERFKYLYNRLCGTLARLLQRMGTEFAQSRFEPAASELAIGAGKAVEPLRLRTAEGAVVTVEGVVDRIDVMTASTGKKYVRVVDYKSGGKEFALNDILYGLNLQMLLYLFTLEENGTDELANCIPAGVLYMPVREQFVSASRSASDGEIAAERAKNWRMSGLLLEDEEALRGMEADLAGVFIPAKVKKDGTLDSKSALATAAQMGKLGEKVREQVTLMGQSLLEGKVPAVPVETAEGSACRFCDYRAVCGFEEGDRVRAIAKLDRDAVLKLLSEDKESTQE